MDIPGPMSFLGVGIDESVGLAVKLIIETKIGFYIHYIYSHTTNLNES